MRVKVVTRRRASIGALFVLLLLLLAIFLTTPAQVHAKPRITVTELVTGLDIPWDLAFTPDRTMLFTERRGRLSARLANGTVQRITADMSDLVAQREGGLMAILVDRNFNSNRRFYTCQTHDDPQEVQVIAWTINNDYTQATRVADPLVGGIPSQGQHVDWQHVGCRLRFGPNGYLWIATGDAGKGTNPQDLTSLGGKVLRVNASTGSGAPGNPFPSSPLVYTYGHRNVQGLALRPGTSQMWAVEHGPDREDEINRLVAGGNYGWDPRETGSDDYDEIRTMTDLTKFPGAIRAKWNSGEPPKIPIAPSGGIFLKGSQWGSWNGRLAVATLRRQTLFIFQFDAAGNYRSHVSVSELDGTYGRLRTPMMGPDGALYITTSNGGNDDRILRVTATNPPRPTNRSPQFIDPAPVTRSVPENSPAMANIGGPVTARDPNGDRVQYRLSGPDRELFDIDAATGQLTTRSPLDYETMPTHTVTVTAQDGRGGRADTTVNIMVTDVDEDGVVDLSPAQASVGTAITASLSDPDGTISAEAWQWAQAATEDGNYTDISDATAASYTPVDAEEGMYLKATVSYTDGYGAGKSAMSSPVVVLAADPLVARYDANEDGEIQTRELVAAINDYIFGGTNALTTPELIRLIKLYIFG